ncbi:MAG: DegT/DnrJ/EryC1/StrS family aminotransferase [Gammaproteobacteria bacterium]
MNLTEPKFDEEEIHQLGECLASHWVTQGPRTAEFERLVGARHQVRSALATTSCTAALHLSTLALELGLGDEVIVPALTWVTSAHCAEYVGARAVFADIDQDTYNLDPDALQAAITPRTRAIVAVHLFGLAANMDPIMGIARKHGLAVIEDAACAIGTSYKSRPVGGIGDISCFSFHPRKVVTTGEGGMVTTNRDDLARRVQSLRNHGSTGLPPADVEPHGPWTMATFDMLGFNLRLSDIQAAVGVAQMAKLDHLLAERRAAAWRYSELLADVEEIVLPTSVDCDGHTFQSYVIRISNGDRAIRNKMMAHLAAHNIQTRPGTHAVHLLGYYRDKYSLRADDFPVAARSQDSTITLPLFPGVTDTDQQLVAKLIKEALTRRI